MAKTKLSIVPKPKSIRFGCGEYKLPPAIEISISAGASGELRTAEKILGKYGTRITSVKKMDWDYSCLAAGNSQNIFPLREKKPAGKEGYVLSVTKQGVGIRANTDAGLFYALQTLAQILEDTRTLPAVRIADYPDLEMRGLHLDFKGGFSTRKHLREMVEKLAGCKINTLLVEYEDKIVYAKNKKFVSPYALSPSEVAEFLKHCRVHHIQVIPLLQSLGHVEYILRHPAYSHLREGENCSQFCPSNPASLKLFEECAAELAELHPEAEWFHIGGDETRALGTCPVCKRKADKSGKTALYVEYITKAIQIIRKLGKKPIIWDDMLTRSGHPELLDNLPEGTTLMYWQYAVTEKESSSIQLEAYLASRRWLTKGVDKRAWEKAPDLVHNILEKDFPDEIRRAYNIYEKYFITKKSPLFFDSLPYLKILRKKKIPVIGASACRTSLDQRFPDVDWRMRNIKFWADVAKTNGLPGVISTSWARAASLGAPGILPEDSWYLMVAAGEFYWNTDSDIRDFDARFNFRFLGIADTRATDLQYSMVECKNLRY
ncbi:MAG: beta-N-acetylhexosaminidase, partial [Candidatus Omnitrophota bacterium]